MKKHLTLLALLLTPILFAQNSNKDAYIKEHLPLLEQNLTIKEFNDFKKSMRFNKKGKLEAQNFALLKKGSGDKFGVYYQYISTERMGKAYPITLVNENGKEMVIEIDGTITFDNTHGTLTTKAPNSQIEAGNIRSYENKQFKVEDILSYNGLFVVTSTGCGPCVNAYKDLNDLANYEGYIKLHFTTLYRDSFDRINTYKEGSSYKSFGELESPWDVFSSDELLKKFKTKYDMKGFPYVFIKKDGKTVYEKFGIKIEEIREVLDKL